MNYLGIEIGGTKLQIVQGDGFGHIARRWRAAVDRARGGPGILEQLRSGLAAMTDRDVGALAVGFGGPVDARFGRICKSHQIHGWDDFPLADWLHDLTGLPATLENDANTAALGEARAGAGLVVADQIVERESDTASSLAIGAGENPQTIREGPAQTTILPTHFSPLFYVTLGSGVGGGLVIDGRIYHGAPPGEAEFGHLRLDRDGTTVESRCSGWAVDARIRRLREEEPASLLARSLPQTPGGEATLLTPALNAGDPAAGRVIREVAADLAFALSHAVHLFHPQIIVLGGGLSLVGEPLRTAVAAHLPLHLMDVFAPGPFVRLAALGEDAVPIGALCLAADHALRIRKLRCDSPQYDGRPP